MCNINKWTTKSITSSVVSNHGRLQDTAVQLISHTGHWKKGWWQSAVWDIPYVITCHTCQLWCEQMSAWQSLSFKQVNVLPYDQKPSWVLDHQRRMLNSLRCHLKMLSFPWVPRSWQPKWINQTRCWHTSKLRCVYSHNSQLDIFLVLVVKHLRVELCIAVSAGCHCKRNAWREQGHEKATHWSLGKGETLKWISPSDALLVGSNLLQCDIFCLFHQIVGASREEVEDMGSS